MYPNKNCTWMLCSTLCFLLLAIAGCGQRDDKLTQHEEYSWHFTGPVTVGSSLVFLDHDLARLAHDEGHRRERVERIRVDRHEFRALADRHRVVDQPVSTGIDEHGRGRDP